MVLILQNGVSDAGGELGKVAVAFGEGYVFSQHIERTGRDCFDQCSAAHPQVAARLNAYLKTARTDAEDYPTTPRKKKNKT